MRIITPGGGVLKRLYCKQRKCFFITCWERFSTKTKNKTVLHNPVMLNESMENLYPQSNDLILDMTFGAGGHTRAILDKCNTCHVLTLDRDPSAYKLAQEMAKEYNGKITPLLGRFSEIQKLFQEHNITPGTLKGAILDAGCSSMQFDNADRGFSLKRDGRLDMRMDGDRFPELPSAADVVNRLGVDDLQMILEKYGQEKWAKIIAERIVDYRRMEERIKTTKQLSQVIASAFHPYAQTARTDAMGRKSHIATKSFMAIRIFVNNELNELYEGMKMVENYMAQGGRFVAITFHSLEDAIVKRVFSGVDVNKPMGMSILQQVRNAYPKPKKEKKWMILQKKVVLPQFEEVYDNNRSRSAKLRAATRL